MVLLAGFNALLSRYCDATDIAVGSPIANRAHPDVQDLIGFFANTLVLRTNLEGNPEFGEIVQRSRDTALGAFAHQEFPFESLVEELAPERDTTRHPLFQVAFAYQNGPLDSFELPGLQAEPVSLPTQEVKFDLTMSLHERKGVVEGTFEYATDRFDRVTAEKIVAAYTRLMTSVVARPEQRLGEIEILDAAETQRLVGVLNATDRDFGPWRSVPERVQAQAEAMPEALAVRAGEIEESYAELDENARRIAAGLRQAGGVAGDVVAVRIERSVAYVRAILGTLYAGMVYLPIDPEEPELRAREVLRDAGARIVLMDGEPEPWVLADHACLQVREFREDTVPVSEGPPVAARPDALAYIVYTSGSTGKPKGVEVPHRGLANLAQWHQETYDLQSSDRSSLVAHVGFDASVWEVWPTLISGGSLHVVPQEVRLDPGALSGWLAEAEIHLSFLPTTLAEAVLQSGETLPHTLRALLTGGDRLSSRSGRAPVCEVVNHYGPTETSVVATSGTVAWGESGPPPIGRPIANTQVRILDRFGALCPVGVPGEIYLGGHGLARGYTGPARLTAERFVPDAWAVDPGARLYRTGDRARYRRDGSIDYLDRLDAQVQIQGVRVEPLEVEEALRQQPEVADVAVVADQMVGGGPRLAAFVVPAGESSLVEDRLRAELAKSLPRSMRPNVYVVLDELPRTSRGKVDRKALQTALPAAVSSGVPPRGELEQALARVWEELLTVENLPREADFFDQGGHSLLATQLLSRIREKFSVDLPLEEVFRHPVLFELAAVIEVRQQSGRAAAEPEAIPQRRRPTRKRSGLKGGR
jgi:amino acid adenylation domain-containing protein